MYGCAGDVEKCVSEKMQEFYKKKNSGIHIFDGDTLVKFQQVRV